MINTGYLNEVTSGEITYHTFLDLNSENVKTFVVETLKIIIPKLKEMAYECFMVRANDVIDFEDIINKSNTAFILFIDNDGIKELVRTIFDKTDLIKANNNKLFIYGSSNTTSSFEHLITIYASNVFEMNDTEIKWVKGKNKMWESFEYNRSSFRQAKLKGILGND